MERGRLAFDARGDLEIAVEIGGGVGGGVGGGPGDDTDVTDMLDGEAELEACVAILTRPGGTRSVHTRGCPATVSWQQGSQRACGETQRPLKGKGGKNQVQKDDAPRVFLVLFSLAPLYEMRTERRFWIERRRTSNQIQIIPFFHFRRLIMMMTIINICQTFALSI